MEEDYEGNLRHDPPWLHLMVTLFAEESEASPWARSETTLLLSTGSENKRMDSHNAARALAAADIQWAT